VLSEGVGEGSRRGIMFGVAIAGSGEGEAHPLRNKMRIKVMMRYLVFMFLFYVLKIKDSPVNGRVLNYPNG